MVSSVEYGFMVFWYIVIIAAVISYAMLDGFDLGVGALHLCIKKDNERRLFLNAIGPVWDGNEVWLVVTVGALMAGFPFAYSTLFSAFYIPLSILIFSLIFRAVAIEFRSKRSMTWWRRSWDVLFFMASVLIALMVGGTLGNLIVGIPLNENHEYIGGIVATFLRPYPILVAILTLSLFVMHGNIFLIMKTEGDLQAKLKHWLIPSMIFFIIAYAVTTLVTLIYQEHMIARFKEYPYLFIIALVNLLLIAAIPFCEWKKKYGFAFVSSSLNILFLLSLFAIGTFPAVIRSSIDPQMNSIKIIDASSSLRTLIVLTVIACIGFPLVLSYGYFIYRLFRGKVKLDHMSY